MIPVEFGRLSTAGAGLVVVGYLFLFVTSGQVVTAALSWARGGGLQVSQQERDVGTIVGKCENVLVLTFVLVGAYTALAVVFAAKGIVRRDDIEKNTLFYLAGTLVNFTYSVVVGVVVAFVLYVI